MSDSTAFKVALLLDAATYPTPPGRVEAVETHMSWVFLTDRCAYKLKKPVRYDFLDFSTLAARHWDCLEEVRLNRRLARDVYRGVAALAIDAQGNANLQGCGDIIDWLVEMRRLPARWMLDELIRRQAWQEADIRRIAERLGRFYRDGAALDVSPAQYLKRLACDIESHGRALSDPAHGLPPSRVEGIMQAQREYLQRQQDLFVRRVSAGRLVEGHGDLRPEHICLKPEPVVFDCLEFNRGFRIVDPLDELAFLALECERLGAPAIGPLLLATYQTVTHDQAPARLLDFYTSLRACLRAKLALWHKQDSAPADWPRWNATAHNYLQWAGRYCGLPPSTTAPEDGCDPLPPSAPDDSHGQQFDQ